jgi:FemAB-related protein (PEP-CTERM system-associated)
MPFSPSISHPATSNLQHQVHLYQGDAVDSVVLSRLEPYFLRGGPVVELSRHPAWLRVLARGLKHVPYCLEASCNGQTTGFLALAYVESLLFGRYLVSLPYLNYGGVESDDESVCRLLIDHALELADRLKVRRLELRHEQAFPHPRLGHTRTDKVQMRLDLPVSVEQLEKGLDGKVRNQVKKGRKSGLTVSWGGVERLSEFYSVFSENMRDLGTPVYSRQLFASALEQFPDRAELCVVHHGPKPVAAALLLHGWGVTEVPSASSLRAANPTCANMLMYFHLLARAIERGQDMFDFGRSSRESGTYRFKKQWGAQPFGAEWQSYLRVGNAEETRADNPRYAWRIRLWQRLPLWLAGRLGPWVVRGIP